MGGGTQSGSNKPGSRHTLLSYIEQLSLAKIFGVDATDSAMRSDDLPHGLLVFFARPCVRISPERRESTTQAWREREKDMSSQVQERQLC